MQKIRKILRAVSEIFKDGLRTTTDGLRTDMGDYIGPSRVNPGSKIKKTTNEWSLRYLKMEGWTHGQERLLRTPSDKPRIT